MIVPMIRQGEKLMLYFKGCTAREKTFSIADATEKLLNLFNVNYHTLENEKCCGSFLLRTGYEEDGIEQMRKNINDFKGKTILTSCAGCYKTLKEDYKKYLGEDLDVIHISQFFADKIDELERYKREKEFSNNNENLNNQFSNNKDNQNKELKVTYHDPCHLGRKTGEFDAPREVITQFAQLLEMENIKENANCCGSGGGVKAAFPDLAKQMAANRVKEAEDTGAEIIISSCPFCKLNLEEAASIEVLDLTEFILNNLRSN